MRRIPRWFEWWLSRILGDRAIDAIGDLEELANDRGPLTRLPWLVGQGVSHTWRAITGQHGVVASTREKPMASIRDDVKLALRALYRTPSLSAAILVTLALAIGATTALFTVADAVLFKSLPFEDADALVVIWETEPPDGRRNPTSPPNLEDFQAATTGLEAFGGWAPERFTHTGDGPPIQALGVRVTAGFFETLRGAPARGRLFDVGSDPDLKTVVLSDGFWSSRFARDPNILGRTVTLDDEAYEVVGIMPETFRFPDDDNVAFWLPLVRYPWEEARWTRTTNMIARLPTDGTIESVRAELEAAAATLAELHPRTNDGWGIEVAPASALVGDQRVLGILLGTVGLVLLIACANVANLLLARTRDRRQELSIRVALGATRTRLARLLLTESATFALVGALLGVGVAVLGVGVLMALEPGTLPRWNPVRVDGRALVFTTAAGLFVALASGLAPAWQASRVGREAPDRPSVGDRRAQRARSVLSSIEVALAVILTTGGALLATSLLKVQAQDPGFESDNLLAATVELPDSRGYDAALIQSTYAELLDRVRAIPGVSHAGWVTALPMSRVGTDYDIEFFRPDRPDLTPTDTPARADFRVVTDGYVETLGIRIAEGRPLDSSDGEADGAGVLVNETLVQRYFPDEDPLGKEIRIYDPQGDAGRIVGVVGDVRHRGLDDQPRPEIYVHFAQQPHNGMTLAMRTEGDPSQWVAPLREVVRSVDPELPLVDVRPMNALLGDSLASRRFNTAILLGFAFLGLAIALVGVYGTIAYAVSKRTREIGVRMALGAARRDVMAQVFVSAGRMILLGLVLGTLGSLVLGRTLDALLYEVSPTEPLVLLGVATSVAVVAVAAVLKPALRASRVDPSVALREG